MKLLLIGQCTLHWGRMEYGNIGNYYVIEPLIRELKKAFPNSEISTTFQMSDSFSKREGIEILPIDLYYGWNKDDLSNALEELGIAQIYEQTGKLIKMTPYIKAVLESELIIDFSGDIWGDNANFLGENRFLIGLIKDRIAQLLKKKTAMIAGSPGPFSDNSVLEYAKEVYRNFDLVTNRESVSFQLMKELRFDLANTKNFACPSFLFQPLSDIEGQELAEELKIMPKIKPSVGFILCGWNFVEGPFDKCVRSDDDYIVFAEAIEYMTEVLNLKVFLLSHSNGFPIPPEPFDLHHGRDYLIAKQLEEVLIKRGISHDFNLIERVNNPWETKAIIKNFDMLVSGRLHGAVAGLSQTIPTVLIDYGHSPKAHKIYGFAKEMNVQHLIADPEKENDIIKKIAECWMNKDTYIKNLKSAILEVEEKARNNFKELKKLLD